MKDVGGGGLFPPVASTVAPAKRKRRLTRHQPAMSRCPNRWPPARVAAFWARRCRIYLKACEDAELVAEALRVVGHSEVNARLKGGEPVSFFEALVNLYVHAHYDQFAGGRQPGAVGPIRLAIRAALGRAPGASTAELWHMVAAAPPRGWTLHDNRAGKYAEGPEAGQNVDYRAFANHASAERRVRKSSVSGAMSGG
ncbi:hypothetical protein WK39_03140 [Burkholderia cepacia]|uniref:hypothetical protein n=1 Tax=Burkholderia cepacia TaxID=292 RepID=UPI00075467A0|nr:hypothetical protein [Burkholderia cepacia]KVS53287.1 hypothetical protein WK39_03140 [Burkholderia cepacia]KVS57751.1 hypothetical protein WK40_25590 [Burkholderia cepacia]CAG9269003.1 conserved hypothetical protein [Burkholderia cepacia]